MRTVQQWFQQYGESHQNPANKTFHWICVPLIAWSLLALLWCVPVPAALSVSPFANWATATVLAVIAYYAVLSVSLAIGMAVAYGTALLITWLLESAGTPLWQTALAVFVLAWVGQFIGHKIEGKKPSFLEDLQFLLIGPLWLLGFVYQRLGIPVARVNRCPPG